VGKTASDLKRAGWPTHEMAQYSPWTAVDRYSHDYELSGRRDQALKIARAAAALLKSSYGATRVVLFGSLAHGLWFTPRSDIDLYVEGLPVETFFKAEAEVEAIAHGFKLDLVDARECSPELSSQIEEEGIDL
jgi:predicted nucleotidyltransferase